VARLAGLVHQFTGGASVPALSCSSDDGRSHATWQKHQWGVNKLG
jgi:hypothetical protein